MRNAALALSWILLAPTLCFALGAEDTEFHGVLDSGKQVRLQFKDDPQGGHERSFVYGTPAPGPLFRCWVTRVNEVPSQFSCSQTQGSKPQVVYDALPIPPQGAHPPTGTPYAEEYRKLARQAPLGSGAVRGDGVVLTVYRCSVGCSSQTPPRLYEVGKFD